MRDMKKQSLNGFFALSIAVILLAAASVILRIAVGEAQGREAARRDFAGLMGIFRTELSVQDLARPELRARLAEHYRKSGSLLLISIYERGAGVRWRLPARSDYLPARENLRPIPQPSYPPQSSLLLASTIPGDRQGLLAVDALYTILPQSTVFAAFRDAALGVAAYLGLVAVFFFFLSLRRPRREGEEDGRDASTEGEAEPEDADSGLRSAEEGTALRAEGQGYAPPEEEEFEIPSLRDELMPEMGEGSAETGIPAEEKLCGDIPEGLFSPLSGLGWESYLADRLDSELARSASFEQDLSLAFFAYDGLSPEMPEYRCLADGIADFFSFKDLAFERGSDGFAVILPNMDADHALRMAEEFLKKITFVLCKDRDPMSFLPLFIGLSSRAGRLVDAARIGQEAKAALQRARDEADSHIIAFRPDPDRYRIYLASKGL
jgi:hypothetical protein